MKVRCPACKDWVPWEETPTRPFCSEVCKGKDLGQWAMEKYRIPVEEPDSAGKDPKPDPDPED